MASLLQILAVSLVLVTTVVSTSNEEKLDEFLNSFQAVQRGMYNILQACVCSILSVFVAIFYLVMSLTNLYVSRNSCCFRPVPGNYNLAQSILIIGVERILSLFLPLCNNNYFAFHYCRLHCPLHGWIISIVLPWFILLLIC